MTVGSSAVQARVEHDEIGEIADAERAIDLVARERAAANRHVFVVCLHRVLLARRPVAFTSFGIVIFRAVTPGIIGTLVIVPHAYKRVQPMRFLQVRIGFV